mgnify:CR=1 FL=1
MKILMIDTATENLYVRFFDDVDGKVFFSKEMMTHNNHSENLLTVIEEGLKLNNIKLKDFNKIIVGEGPGSYTGLRVAMVVAKMASYTLNIPLYTVSSLTYVGSGYLNNLNENILISIKAKKGHSYIKVYEKETNRVLVEDIFLTDEEKEKIISQYSAYVVNESNYKLNEEIINRYAVLVDNVHELTPNYLRKANSWIII